MHSKGKLSDIVERNFTDILVALQLDTETMDVRARDGLKNLEFLPIELYFSVDQNFSHRTNSSSA